MSIKATASRLARAALFQATCPPLRRWWRSRREGANDVPPVGLVRFGSLRRLNPVSREWGDDRGGPIDRCYITDFLAAHQEDVRGRVMEIGEDVYAKWFGEQQVSQIDIFEYPKDEPSNAAFVGDLASADHVPSNVFDCVIVTQTLQLIYDVRAAVRTIHRILKPGGVALITVPGITPINHHDSGSWGDYWCWSFTALSMRRLFEESFGATNVQVETHGNVLAAAGFLYGLGKGELSRAEIDYRDPDYPLIITVRAVKAGSRD